MHIALVLLLSSPGFSLTSTSTHRQRTFLSPPSTPSTPSSSLLRMMSAEETEQERTEALDNIKALVEAPKSNKNRFKSKYKRKREKPITEKEADELKEQRQAEYEDIVSGQPASIWSFENMFPEPVWDDEASIQRDLFKNSGKDNKMKELKKVSKIPAKLRSSIGGSSMIRRLRESKLNVPQGNIQNEEDIINKVLSSIDMEAPISSSDPATLPATPDASNAPAVNQTIDFEMTQRVEGAVYGIRPTAVGDYLYDTSLLGEGAVQFREGVRLGNALKVNADRLNYLAKTELAKNRLEEAQELYEKALSIDPRDGRSYLGLSRIAEKRRDFKLARQCLRSGIANSVSVMLDGQPDFGDNPFLLQRLGCLEETAGHLAEAETLYISAVRSRPSHAAAWVALAQLRTRKLRQNAAAGRICFQTAERELERAAMPPSAHVYTAWAALEYKKAGDIRRARELFQSALDIDPKCSAAYLQLGVMEADKENWEAAETCFNRVLKFDKRNSRVLQAYAIMESKRTDGSSRKAIDLFERALQARPRDAVVLQAYALYVVKLGDIDSARSL
jgi:tetratricopeptide (TPR) repeat protein